MQQAMIITHTLISFLQIHYRDSRRGLTKEYYRTSDEGIMKGQFSVNTTSLNLRSTAASDDSSNIIASLPNGQIVMKLEGTSSDKWWKVSTNISGTPLTGFVNHNYLLFLGNPLEDIVTNGQSLTLEEFKKNEQLVLEVQKKLRNLGLYPGGPWIDGKLEDKSIQGLSQFCLKVGLGLPTATNAIDSTLAKELLDKKQIPSILLEQAKNIGMKISDIQINTPAVGGDVAYLDRTIKNSPFESEVKNYPAYLGRKPDGTTLTSYGEIFQLTGSEKTVTFSDYPSRGNLPEIDEDGLSFLDDSIGYGCVCVGSFVPGEDKIKTHWLGKKSLKPKQFLSATKFIGVLNTICKLNKMHPSCDVDNCIISDSEDDGRQYRFYSLLEDMVTYAGTHGLSTKESSNSIAAMFKRFSTYQGLENWIIEITNKPKLITDEPKLKFKGVYGEEPVISSPVLFDKSSSNDKKVVLRVAGPDTGRDHSDDANLISAYDLVRLISMLGWHLHLPPSAKLPDAEWNSLESVVRAMGFDTARYIDLALETLGLVNVVSEPVIISKMGFGGSALTYVAFVRLVDNRQIPSKLRTLAMALWTSPGPDTNRDNNMAAAVIEIIRRVFTEELA
jgi:hypothetical protein